MRVTVLMLQPLAVKSGSTGRAAEQEALGLESPAAQARSPMR